jgi:hypothetical protein
MIHYNHFCVNSKQILILILVSPHKCDSFRKNPVSVTFSFSLFARRKRLIYCTFTLDLPVLVEFSAGSVAC